ncbi:hypothetical protein SH584_03090 [Sphingomonas sp. LY29]|uniref:hypothetical protein n=1 Tax=Sphingomonas sp. LY29 TaxID=3095341 RepID=UPI002D77F2E2|nr:hypothetical protein [Sphingomonas sp. LY29]WRP26439.1 hypothetical protein SH584_03090 [Sphingomonas sp. LY29]
MTASVTRSETGRGLMGVMDVENPTLFISGRAALTDAAMLIDAYGDDAGFEAAARAESSRDKGNVIRFCHWRQIERVIVTLSDRAVTGTVH